MRRWRGLALTLLRARRLLLCRVYYSVKIFAGREDFPYGIGVRPSSGAGTFAETSTSEISHAFLNADVAAPDDGRTPFPLRLCCAEISRLSSWGEGIVQIQLEPGRR